MNDRRNRESKKARERNRERDGETEQRDRKTVTLAERVRPIHRGQGDRKTVERPREEDRGETLRASEENRSEREEDRGEREEDRGEREEVGPGEIGRPERGSMAAP